MFALETVKVGAILDLPKLTIRAQQQTLITGASGSGKTTLLKLLNKIISPTTGSIFFKGVELSAIDSVKLRRQVVMVPQQPSALGNSIRELLLAGHKLQNKEQPAEATMLNLLERLGILHPLDYVVTTLSGGELQRLAVARALLLEPEVVLLDEPTSALDVTAAKSLFAILSERVVDAGLTVIAVTHSPHLAKEGSWDHIALKHGAQPECWQI